MQNAGANARSQPIEMFGMSQEQVASARVLENGWWDFESTILMMILI